MKGHVLYVEDDQSVREAIERCLRLHDYEVYACASFEEAGKALLNFQFDAAVSDWNLGKGGTGGQVYDLVKRHQPQLAKRFMFFSGDTPETEDHVPWLEKPATNQEVLKALADLLKPERQTRVRGSRS